MLSRTWLVTAAAARIRPVGPRESAVLDGLALPREPGLLSYLGPGRFFEDSITLDHAIQLAVCSTDPSATLDDPRPVARAALIRSREPHASRRWSEHFFYAPGRAARAAGRSPGGAHMNCSAMTSPI